MHLSGILVLGDPLEMERCRAELESLADVEVHHADAATGRMIAVLESEGLAGQQDGLRRIQELPSVRLAALVEHRIVDETGGPREGAAGGADRNGGRTGTAEKAS